MAELSKIKSIDGNILKTMLGVPIQCHTSNLQTAFEIDTFIQFCELSKSKFIKRLTDNAYTKKILEYTITNEVKGSLAVEYIDNHNEFENRNLETNTCTIKNL